MNNTAIAANSSRPYIRAGITEDEYQTILLDKIDSLTSEEALEYGSMTGDMLLKLMQLEVDNIDHPGFKHSVMNGLPIVNTGSDICCSIFGAIVLQNVVMNGGAILGCGAIILPRPTVLPQFRLYHLRGGEVLTDLRSVIDRIVPNMPLPMYAARNYGGPLPLVYPLTPLVEEE